MSNNNTTYKDSPIGKIPSDWEVKKIKDIGKITSGTTPLRSDLSYHTNGTIHWVKTTDLNNSTILDTEEKITCLALEKTSLRIYPIGTVLVAMYGGFNQIGRTGLLGIEATINQALSAITVDSNKISPKFLLEWFNGNLGLWKNLAGSSRKDPNITSKDVGDFPVLEIPLPEQKAIATLLSTWDKAITTTQKLITQKEQQKKWLMQMLLTGKKRLNCDLFDFCDGHDLKTDNKKSGKSFNHKNHGSDNWKELRLGEIFNRITRKNNEYNTNVVTISAQRGFVRQTDFFNKSIASEITDNYFLVEKGEFCYNKSYSNGYPWGATKRLNDFDKAVVTTLYICFGLRNSQKNSGDFFEHYFEANLLDQGLTKIAHEGGRAHGLLNVTPNDFFDLKITIPAFEEQTAIAQVLQAADKEIQLLKAKADKLKEQKKGLMQQLLTGKKRLKYEN